MLCAALSASARPALLRPRGAAQPATTHRTGGTACVPAAAAAGRASRCAAPLAADIHILRSYSSRRTSVRVAASAEEPAASSPSSPDVRSSEQQQALPPAPTPSSPLPPAAADPHAARLPPPASAAAVTAALSSVVGGVVDARLAGVRGQLVQEVVATLTSEPRLLLKELLLVIGEHAPASGGTDTAELRRRVTDLLEARMEELGAAKGQQQQRGGEGAAKQGSGSSGPGGEPTETGGGGGGGGGGSGGGGVGGGGGRRRAGGGGGGSGGAGGSGSAPNLAVAVGAVAMILACCVAWALEDGQQLYQREREPPAGAEETAAAVGVRAVGSTPGPYPGIRLPHTSPIPGQVVTLDNVCVGLVVRRGPDWDKIYTNFMEAGVDGGPGNDGVVTNVSKTGRYASVRWNATGETSYSCNITGMPGYHELVVAPAEAQRRKWPWEWVWRKQ